MIVKNINPSRHGFPPFLIYILTLPKFESVLFFMILQPFPQKLTLRTSACRSATMLIKVSPVASQGEIGGYLISSSRSRVLTKEVIAKIIQIIVIMIVPAANILLITIARVDCLGSSLNKKIIILVII